MRARSLLKTELGADQVRVNGPVRVFVGEAAEEEDDGERAVQTESSRLC